MKKLYLIFLFLVFLINGCIDADGHTKDGYGGYEILRLDKNSSK